MLFAEERNKDSKGIVYLFDSQGNINGPSYKKKNGEICPNPDKDQEYRSDLLRKNETNWFEFEWDTNSDHMQISRIKDEYGENK